MRSLSVVSPAKVNLALFVTGRLPDGYHRLVTLFHRISLADQMTLTPQAAGFRLISDCPGLPLGEDNLITRAYRLVQKKIPGVGGVQVRLRKRIPMQAGLGGGSSNAANFLLALKRLYRLPLGRDELIALGGQLGADVPFFLYETPQALGEGRGDEIRPLVLNRKRWFVLVLSSEPLSTPRVYGEWDKHFSQGHFLTKKERVDRIRCLVSGREKSLDWAAKLYNDLEGPACRLCPGVRKTMAMVVQLGAPAVAMSGSGPAVFAVMDGEQEARALKKRLEKFIAPGRIKICRTLG